MCPVSEVLTLFLSHPVAGSRGARLPQEVADRKHLKGSIRISAHPVRWLCDRCQCQGAGQEARHRWFPRRRCLPEARVCGHYQRPQVNRSDCERLRSSITAQRRQKPTCYPVRKFIALRTNTHTRTLIMHYAICSISICSTRV